MDWMTNKETQAFFVGKKVYVEYRGGDFMFLDKDDENYKGALERDLPKTDIFDKEYENKYGTEPFVIFGEVEEYYEDISSGYRNNFLQIFYVKVLESYFSDASLIVPSLNSKFTFL